MPIRDDFRAGEGLGAHDLNGILDELRRLAKVSAAPPLHVSDDGAGGFHYTVDLNPTFPIKILDGGSAGKYPWTGQRPVSGGGWVDDTTSGTLAVDPACEANGNASVPDGTIVLRAWRDPQTNTVRFERGAC